MHDFKKTPTEMGDWNGEDAEAAQCWNDLISPSLRALHDRVYARERAQIEGEEGWDWDVLSELVRREVWNRFCDKSDDESWEELGQRLAAYLDNQYTFQRRSI